MTKSGVSALLCAGFFALGFSAPANADTYNLALTPITADGSTLAGSGTLTFTDGPVSPSGQFDVTVADITTLTITINTSSMTSTTFNLLGHISDVRFESGVLNDLTAGPVVVNGQDLSSSNTTTFYFNSGNGVESFDTITATLAPAATPLPAALPMFAGGLGMVGFLARRRKRKAAA